MVIQRHFSVLQSFVCVILMDFFFNLVSWGDIHSTSNLGISGLIFFIFHSTKQDVSLSFQKGAHHLYCTVYQAESVVSYNTTNKLPKMTLAQHSSSFYRVMQRYKITHISQILERCITLVLQYAMKNCQSKFPDLVIPLKIGFSLSIQLNSNFTLF